MSLNKRLFLGSSGGSGLDNTDPLGQGTDTLEAFYDFNGNYQDSSGHGNHATNTSNGIVTSTYLEIDGVGNDYITLGRNYNIGESVSFWFQVPSDPGADEAYRILSQDGANYFLWDGVFFIWTDSTSTMTLYQWARWSSGYSYKTLKTDTSFTFGKWYFIVVNFTTFSTTNYSYDGSDLASVYAKNGSNGSTFYSNGPHVGRQFSNSTLFYSNNFYLDKLRIFSDELTNAQVQTLYSETPNT